MGKTNNGNGIESYVIFTDSGENVMSVEESDHSFSIRRGHPERMGFHMMRSVDSQAFYLNNVLITFAMMPGFMFTSVIRPRKINGKLGHRIDPQGGSLRASNGEIMGTSLYEFVRERSQLTDEQKISDRQKAKIEASIKGKIERWDNSRTKMLAELSGMSVLDE
ncbi:hypothetical protein GCM10010844_06900 [Deinococcus radiotolerans]|uniref:Uncharacterized protein n=2 Tax=Deinococcus radiotolerans TaxID=1309407 RepID=A0ABQ2FEP7_9DEIO|nr:hypothetical protein GCM10010844_06900 [Deinococcus radiotolerans]